MKNTRSLNNEKIKSLPKFWTGLTGFFLVLMALSAGIAYGYSFSSLYDAKDSGQTLNHLLQDPNKLTIGLAFWILILMLDILVSFGFYNLLKPALKPVAVWVTVSRIAYSCFLTLALSKVVRLWFLLYKTPADVSANFAQNSFLNFNVYWSLGLIVFGIHLLLLGYAFIKISIAPKSLCYLILFAGFSYMLVHSLGQFGDQGLNLRYALEPILALPMALAELFLAIWLIFISLYKPYKA